MLELYRKNELSPVETIESAFKRVDRLNPQLNALVTLNKEQALKAAAVSERLYASGSARALEGLPVVIKDLTNTRGIRTTYGSLVYKNHVPERDATIVSRLRQAGAIILGKSNTPEFGHKGTTNSRIFPPARNPWNLENGTGGSSGGSAAAVAAGFCPIAEGSDGGGSIRIPSSLCGVFGFKPSFGRVPCDNHPESVFSNTVPFISYGPIARSVYDASLMFDVIQGPSIWDPFSLDPLTPSVTSTLTERKRPFRVGYTLDFGMYSVDEEIRQIFHTTLNKLEKEGAIVEPADIQMKKNLSDYVRYFNRLWMIGLAVQSKKMMRDCKDQLSASLISMIHRGEDATVEEYLGMNAYRTYLWRMFQKQFQSFDVLISPTLAAVAYPYNEEGPSSVNGQPINPESDWMMTSPVNLTGEPACSLPIGRTRAGLPVGMQCIAGHLQDRCLFQFAKWAESMVNMTTLAGKDK
ncbi:amidase [Sporolactobacillus sp. Y61]|uniref:Amidase n=2 Tax=unclassified Sporolactobacillus TaxID=2628533 RepID=A0AAU8IDV9_9BACL